MKLAELDPLFLKVTGGRTYQRIHNFADADGLMLLCPKCFAKNGGPKGTHVVMCWRPHVPQTIKPTPGRWEFRGTGIGDLTLFAGSSSIRLVGGCDAHFFIKNGEIELC